MKLNNPKERLRYFMIKYVQAKIKETSYE